MPMPIHFHAPLAAQRATALVAALCALTLTSCAADPVDDRYPDLSLAQAKSNVQLQRNEAAGAIPENLVAILLGSTDLSSACEPETSDPEGLIRAWESEARVRLIPGADLDAVVDDLVANFVDQGWDEKGNGTTASTTLIKSTILTEIHVTATEEVADSDMGAEVTLSFRSPCVVTDGETSDEVLELEAMAY